MKTKILILFLMLFSLVLVSCKVHDGYDAARLNTVNILNTPDGDNEIEITLHGETWAQLELLGEWYEEINVGSVRIVGPGCDKSAYKESFSVFTSTRIVTQISVSGCQAGIHQVYIDDDDADIWYSSNKKNITMY